MSNPKVEGCTHVVGTPEVFVEVSNLETLAITHNSASISWSYQGQFPTTYTYKLSDPGATLPETCAGGITTDKSNIELSNLVPEKQYHIRVCTKSNKQNLSVGVALTFTTKPAPIISNDVLDLIVSKKTDRTADVTWRANNPPASKYMIKIDRLELATTNCTGGVETSDFSYQAGDLNPETRYVARVCSLRSNGTFNTGIAIEFQTESPPDIIYDVLGLAVSAKNKNSFTLSWSPNIPVPAKYLVSIRKGQEPPPEQCQDGEVQFETTRSFTSLDAETDYFVRVCSVSNRGKVTGGAVILVMTDPLYPPPVEVSDLRIESKTHNFASFTWKDSSTVNKNYLVRLSEAQELNPSYCDGGLAQVELSYKSLNLKPKTNYIFRVCAQSEIGKNTAGKLVSFTTDPEPPYFGDGPWTNKRNAVDINDDGFVSPLDALSVINELNRSGSRALDTKGPQTEPYLYYDVNADGFISPLDVLLVINYINQKS
jgi:hypothetical protein